MKRITSRANPLLRELARLGSSPHDRRERRRILLDGPHLIDALLASGNRPELVVISDSGAARTEVQSLLARCGNIEVIGLPDPVFAKVAVVQSPAGIMAVAPIPPRRAHDADAAMLFLDGLQDPGNVGTLLRSAAATGVGAVLLAAGCTDAWSPRALRAAMGAHFLLAIEEQADLAAAIKRYPGRVLAAQGAGGRSPYEIDLRGPIALLVGAEGRGLSPALAALAHDVVTIPMASGVESLNVGVAISVLLYESVRQRRANATTTIPRQ